jgi:hypothetical protein
VNDAGHVRITFVRAVRSHVLLGAPDDDVAGVVAPEDVGATITVVIADVGHAPLLIDAMRVGNRVVSVQPRRQPDLDIAGCVVLP